MALELTLVHELEPPVPFTCANGTGIEKGSLLKLTDPMTAIINSGDRDAICGVAAEEKIASDGKTTIGVYLRGVFKATAGGAITVGDIVTSSSGAANELITATAAADNSAGCGIALETASDTDTFMVLINVGIGGSVET